MTMKKFLSVLIAAAMIAATLVASAVSVSATGAMSGAVQLDEQSDSLYTRDGDYIYFGEYPQTVISGDVGITDVVDERGYWLGSDGEYYAAITASPHHSGYSFSTGESVTSGYTYYFKVEPIRWRILSEGEGVAFVLCDGIIDSQVYDYGGYNNYAESDIRAWLNDGFYNTAFNELQKQIIITTEVDNSVASTGYSENQYACSNTFDKVFLLSAAEAINSEYGFVSSNSSSDSARSMQTSDYSRAIGAYTDGSCGAWWFRSSSNLASNYVQGVDASGNANYHSEEVDKPDLGVVPAMNINLSANGDGNDGSETEPPLTGPDEEGYYRFVPHTEGEDTIWESMNQGVTSSTARMTFTSQVNGTFSFDMSVSSESGCDVLRVYVNGNHYYDMSGSYSYQHYEISVSVGDEIRFEYSKDGSVDGGSDTAYVKNILFAYNRSEVPSQPPVTGPAYETDENGYYGFTNTTDGENTIWQSTNQYYSSSTSRMSIVSYFTGYISFYASVSSESNYDYLRVYKNGETVVEMSGSYSYEYYEIPVVDGDELVFTYTKDGGTDIGTDTAYIKGITYMINDTFAPSDGPATEEPTEDPTEESTEVYTNEFGEIVTAEPDDSTEEFTEESTDDSDESGETEGSSDDSTDTSADTSDDSATDGETVTEEETYTADEDGIFDIIEDESGNLITTNKKNDGSVSRKTISCESAGRYTMTVSISSEEMCDKLIVYVGDRVVYVGSGEKEEYVDFYVSSEDVITIEYVKDESGSVGSDRAVISLEFFEGEVSETEALESPSETETEKKDTSEKETVSTKPSGSGVGTELLGGCFSTLGTSAVVVILTVITSLAVFRRKED